MSFHKCSIHRNFKFNTSLSFSSSAHPNVKVFIMQGGVQSFQEAVHFGVPIIGIPWYGDQYINTAKMVDAEIGVRLLPKELHSYDKIKSALNTVLYDGK